MTWGQWLSVVLVGLALVGLAAGSFWVALQEREPQDHPSRADLYRLAKSMEKDGFDVDYELLGIEDLAGNPSPYVLYRNGIISNNEYASLLYAQNQARREEDAKRRKKIKEMMAELDRKGVPYSVQRSYQGGIISVRPEEM